MKTTTLNIKILVGILLVIANIDRSISDVHQDSKTETFGGRQSTVEGGDSGGLFRAFRTLGDLVNINKCSIFTSTF